MKFINREKELQMLARVSQAGKEASKMTVVVGRRRIGKTRLISESQKETRLLFIC
ncbi:MAG: ATP-binding protein [Haliscomenobacteraceae bacterium CHB4]|nr:ATP-binding protein [Haliscomenobacteraceae bacterium CHB4]